MRSTVALKAAMAVSGLVMVLYLLAHMYGNLKVFSGQAAFDGYSAICAGWASRFCRTPVPSGSSAWRCWQAS
jgi:succinate dehydrogenase hydrophobic anchor subunit